jgi:phosphatidylserine/phosphatidylglycerophosphate/cardiolipin synthase-like enzyme
MQSTCWGRVVDKLPDSMPVFSQSRVTVSEFPRGKATIFPPYYKRNAMPKREIEGSEVPVVSMGRYGSVLRWYRPSDDAFLAMFDSARTSIRLALQDLGPICIPFTKIPIPGFVWPKKYLSALGRAIWTRGVNVEIVVSNPGSIPGSLTITEALYGNGWTCVDVAAEIIKTIRKQFPESADVDLRKKVAENLRVCFLRRKTGNKWDNGKDTLGLHSKHFIIDDICAYIGSQNLYICDLAEWGIVIDHAGTVKKVMDEYWNLMWAASFTGQDCDVQEVMDGLAIDRDGEQPIFFTTEQREMRKQAASSQRGSTPFLLDETRIKIREG